MLINYIVFITFDFKTIQVIEFLRLYLILRKFKCSYDASQNLWWINSVHSIFFCHITRRQAISPVAKFHCVLERGFMIQRVILIFIKCLSANQIQLFYKKVWYMHSTVQYNKYQNNFLSLFRVSNRRITFRPI